MSKIAKFIKSALNNSSANEAAQALKMAAATMQKEGLNPAEFLQEKGADSDSSAVNSLKATVDRLQRELEAAKRTTGGANVAELREAKELAIKWHRVAQAQEAHLKELAPIAVEAQEKVKKLTGDVSYLQKLVKFFGVGGVVAAIACFAFGSSNGEDTGRSLQANANWSEMQSKDQEITSLKNQVAFYQAKAEQPAPAPINTGKATCWIQGQFTTKSGKPIPPTSIKFWFNNGVVTTLENNRKDDSETVDYDRASFVSQINKAFPGKTDCKLGVNK
ncbi:TPA: hypothetical protein JLH60_004771 [Escherichia coli]|nr:hypothetical protein [Escherichia coli]